MEIFDFMDTHFVKAFSIKLRYPFNTELTVGETQCIQAKATRRAAVTESGPR